MSNRITLTRAEALAILLLTGDGADRALRVNRDAALKAFPGLSKVINSVVAKDLDDACYNLVDTVKKQLAQFNEDIINKERRERERAQRAQQNDLFYKNVTGLLKKLNDSTFLTAQERLDLATKRYPEADIRLNRLDKLEYFGRVVPKTSPLGQLLKEKLAGGYPKRDF